MCNYRMRAVAVAEDTEMATVETVAVALAVAERGVEALEGRRQLEDEGVEVVMEES